MRRRSTLDATFVGYVEGGALPSVNALVVDSGVLYIGGAFTTVNISSHANLAAVSAATGATVATFTVPPMAA